MLDYQLVYADPPWKFSSRSHWSKTKFGLGIHAEYTGMDHKEMCSIPVKKIVAQNSLLYMWTTPSHHELAYDVMRAWGFRPSTYGMNWTKINRRKQTVIHGTGRHLKQSLEVCLLGIRGKPPLVASNKIKADIHAPRPLKPGTNKIWHSRKPEEAYQKLELAYPTLKRIELFARPPLRPNWDSLGYDIDQMDITVAIQEMIAGTYKPINNKQLIIPTSLLETSKKYTEQLSILDIPDIAI